MKAKFTRLEQPLSDSFLRLHAKEPIRSRKTTRIASRIRILEISDPEKK